MRARTKKKQTEIENERQKDQPSDRWPLEFPVQLLTAARQPMAIGVQVVNTSRVLVMPVGAATGSCRVPWRADHHF